MIEALRTAHSSFYGLKNASDLNEKRSFCSLFKMEYDMTRKKQINNISKIMTKKSSLSERRAGGVQK